MPVVLMAIGAAGVGKTTQLRKFPQEFAPTAVYISSDDIREELCGNQAVQSVNGAVWPLFYGRVAQAIAEGKNVVLDCTNTKVHERRHLVDHCWQSGASDVVGAWFDASLATCLERNAQRTRTVPTSTIESMVKNLEAFPPALCDGFSRLEIINTERSST